MNEIEKRLKMYEDLVHCLDALKAAGWIEHYDLSMEDIRPTILWTAKGRERARMLTEIDDELNPGEQMWTILLAVCKFFALNKSGDGLN